MWYINCGLAGKMFLYIGSLKRIGQWLLITFSICRYCWLYSVQKAMSKGLGCLCVFFNVSCRSIPLTCSVTFSSCDCLYPLSENLFNKIFDWASKSSSSSQFLFILSSCPLGTAVIHFGWCVLLVGIYGNYFYPFLWNRFL